MSAEMEFEQTEYEDEGGPFSANFHFAPRTRDEGRTECADCSREVQYLDLGRGPRLVPRTPDGSLLVSKNQIQCDGVDKKPSHLR